jgi:hypothetical protein
MRDYNMQHDARWWACRAADVVLTPDRLILDTCGLVLHAATMEKIVNEKDKKKLLAASLRIKPAGTPPAELKGDAHAAGYFDAGAPLSRDRDVGHSMALGATGSGKTTFDVLKRRP